MRGLVMMALCVLGISWIAVTDADFSRAQRQDVHHENLKARLTTILKGRGFTVFWEKQRLHALNPHLIQYQRLKRGEEQSIFISIEGLRTLLEASFRKARALHFIELDTDKFLVVFEMLIDKQPIGSQVPLSPEIHMHNGLWVIPERWKEFDFSREELRNTFSLVPEAATMEEWIITNAKRQHLRNLTLGAGIISIGALLLVSPPLEKRCIIVVRAILRRVRRRKKSQLKRSMPMPPPIAIPLKVVKRTESLPATDSVPSRLPNSGGAGNRARPPRVTAIKQEWEDMIQKLRNMIASEPDLQQQKLLQELFDELTREGAPRSFERAEYALFRAAKISSAPLFEPTREKLLSEAVPRREQFVDLLPIEKLQTLLEPSGINVWCVRALIIWLLNSKSKNPYFRDYYVGFEDVKDAIMKMGFSRDEVVECTRRLAAIHILLWQDNKRYSSCSLNTSSRNVSYPADEVIKLLVAARQELRRRLS